MKIVHLCLCGVYTENLNYQENVLTKYHKKMGNEVTIITSQWMQNPDGSKSKDNNIEYFNDNGVKVLRIPIKKGTIDTKLKVYPTLIEKIDTEKPEILFIHGPQFLDLLKISKYLRKRKIKVYVDNHADFYNSGKNWISRNILHKIIWKFCAKSVESYVEKFYGVLPARVDFLHEIYNIKKNLCELLVMGADDDFVEGALKANNIINTRIKYNIKNDDFLIVTGGKINSNRPETISLMRAIKQLENQKVKLIVFGSVSKELKKEFDSLIETNNIIFAGWQDVKGTYNIMGCADLIIFPGLHSVMWEQAVALGVPCIFRKIHGFNHIDLNGNCILLEDVSISNLLKNIEYILENKEEYRKMKNVAQSGRKYFSYKYISMRSIESRQEKL